jgi:hypothetical protein
MEQYVVHFYLIDADWGESKAVLAKGERHAKRMVKTLDRFFGDEAHAHAQVMTPAEFLANPFTADDANISYDHENPNHVAWMKELVEAADANARRTAEMLANTPGLFRP